MFVRRMWISKLISEERTDKVEYGKLYIIYCLFIYIHVYLCKNVNSEGIMED